MKTRMAIKNACAVFVFCLTFICGTAFCASADPLPNKAQALGKINPADIPSQSSASGVNNPSGKLYKEDEEAQTRPSPVQSQSHAQKINRSVQKNQNQKMQAPAVR